MEKEFVYLNPEKNAEGQKGALSGKTVALEPDISVKGWPSDTGSPALENYTAVEDAVIVERLCAAGAYIKGYTRMSELGFGLHWNTTAQAVSGGKADIAVMADKMGELRVSAASFGILEKFFSNCMGMVLSVRVRRKYSSWGRIFLSSGLYSSMDSMALPISLALYAP